MNIISLLTTIGLICHCLYGQCFCWLKPAEKSVSFEWPTQIDSLPTIQGHSLIQPASPHPQVVKATYWVVITGYSSTPDQTDSTPFITASGTYVEDGIVAEAEVKDLTSALSSLARGDGNESDVSRALLKPAALQQRPLLPQA